MNDYIDLPFEDEGGAATAPRPRRRTALIVLLIVLALIIAGGIVAGTYLNSLKNAYEKHTTVTLDDDTDLTGEGQNILLLGSDKRSTEDAKAEGVSGQRSDTIMLVHIPADGGEAYIVSFPRDLYVDIPGHGKDRINAALAFGGLPLAVTTLENYTQVPIDHVALIDFDGIKAIVDSLGGVDVNIPKSFTRDGKTFTQGTQHLDGDEALVFARERKSFADGDFQRNRDQQQLLKGIAVEFISRDTLTSPGKLKDAVESISPYLTTDDGLDAGTLVKLGWDNRSLRGSDLHFLEAPHGAPTTTSGGASVVSSDESGMDELRKCLKDDTMEQYAADQDG
ncbi:LCP family protein [Brachybacterium sp. MASK1Z-5]|uniref:LCP family protein n=1 Tax=Brachybacterium halotolerans TaxID=2795215 RepID=A0ABS1B7V2_9MICO|nr:LCP family protein [Brachybacterium halotolerans]MBK0330736.1 LCP family protein [Brachybacterium halotolerans]